MNRASTCGIEKETEKGREKHSHTNDGITKSRKTNQEIRKSKKIETKWIELLHSDRNANHLLNQL